MVPGPGVKYIRTMTKAVTFDCAQTLVKVDWQPAVLAVKSAKMAGLEFDMAPAAETYDRKLRSRWPEFRELNKTRDGAVLAAFWRELTLDWLTEMEMDVEKTDDVGALANELLFGEDSKIFQVYDDVVPCLQRLQAAQIRMAVISNWDHSLHKTLAMFDLQKYFEVVLASLEEGIEKPEPGLFQIALDRLGQEPEDVLHVGDSPLDDWHGARSVGMKAVVIDRDADAQTDVRITSLDQLPGVLGL